MKNIKSIGTIGVLTLFLVACSRAEVLLPDVTASITPARAVKLPDTATLTTAPQATATASPDTQEPPLFPLAEPGPYTVSRRRFIFEDTSRANRRVSISVWYPAMLSEGSIEQPLWVGKDLDPDLSGAPYPLLLSSTEMASTFARYLVSHGFGWVSVDGIRSYEKMDKQMYTQPLDILFALDKAAKVSEVDTFCCSHMLVC